MRSLLLIFITSSVLLACERDHEPNTTAPMSTEHSAHTQAVGGNVSDGNSGETTAGAVEFIDPWIRMVPAVSPNSAAYLEIRNGTKKTITLSNIQSQLANRIEIHDVEIDDDGTMKMFKIDSLEIEPADVAQLNPGGTHIMIYGLNEPLTEGEMATMLISFDQQPPIPVNFTVK